MELALDASRWTGRVQFIVVSILVFVELALDVERPGAICFIFVTFQSLFSCNLLLMPILLPY